MGNCFSQMINFFLQRGNSSSQMGNSSSQMINSSSPRGNSSSQMASMKSKRESSPSPSPSPSSSSTRQWKYEVFLSFRGGDTRFKFTDHLYTALRKYGIDTFRDEEEVKTGESISKIFEAIEESQIVIIIFSENYASSEWCLDEVAKIIKCREDMGLIVVPIFYELDPSVVEEQTGPFKQAFIDHRKHFEHRKVETWRAALREVASIKGWHLENRHESEFIQHVVKEVMKKLSSKSSSTKNFIGMESELEKFIPSYLGFENDVRMIGIYGMGGLGKTTLARVVYDEYRNNFEGSSFIHNVREDSKKEGLPKLQQQLLQDILKDKSISVSNVYDGVDKIMKRLNCQKVLLVIDDVDNVDQLQNLAGRHDWFGLGSWIIITTRDERVLIQHEVPYRYNPKGLNTDDALKLFCLKAFKIEQPKEGYMQLSQEVVNYANGLPLALVVLGSYLYGRTMDYWKKALPSFEETKGKIFDILKISYDGLEILQKEIFLDIACFFRRWKKDVVIQILDNCGFNASNRIISLLEKSLLSVDDNEYLQMHDLLQEMGENIVLSKSKGRHEKQSRWWLKDDLLRVSKENMATNAIEAIVVENRQEDFNYAEFLEVLPKMSNLRLMIINDNFSFLKYQRYLDVPNQLRHLSWNSCPLKCLSFSSQPMKLVHLQLHSSHLKYLWHGVMDLLDLKFIDLSYSFDLIRTPDFSGVPMLEKLNLSSCRGLVEIHPSIGQLSKLRYLNLQSCSKISTIPKFSGKMKFLSELNFSDTAIMEVAPSSIECLAALTLLDLGSCQHLEYLPSNMHNLRSLKKLNLNNCSNLKSLPRVPSTIRAINARSCSSLKWSLAPGKLSSWSQPLSQWCPYDERGIRVEFKILFRLLQLQGLLRRKTVHGTSSKREEDGSRTKFLIIFPSCSIQMARKSISIELPSNWYNSKWIGFALWASEYDIKEREDDIRTRVIALGEMPQNQWVFDLSTTLIYFGYRNIFLLYLSHDKWFDIVGSGKCSQIKVIFEFDESPINLGKHGVSLNESFRKVRMNKLTEDDDDDYDYGDDYDDMFENVYDCGFSLIYEQDMDEFNQTNAQCLIESFGEKSIYKLTVGDDDDDDDDKIYGFC